jgi:hypothetical protein
MPNRTINNDERERIIKNYLEGKSVKLKLNF